MANWCSNTVEFIGEHGQFEELGKLFNEMAEKEKLMAEGQLPLFWEHEGGWLFEIRWENGILYYETKWAPNSDVILAIARHFNVGYKYEYYEPGNVVYGEENYLNGELISVGLDWDDTDLYRYNEDTERYEFEGISYECSEEILEILLERKKAALNSPELKNQ